MIIYGNRKYEKGNVNFMWYIPKTYDLIDTQTRSWLVFTPNDDDIEHAYGKEPQSGAYLETIPSSAMKLFCKNGYWVKAVNYFCKKAQS